MNNQIEYDLHLVSIWSQLAKNTLIIPPQYIIFAVQRIQKHELELLKLNNYGTRP